MTIFLLIENFTRTVLDFSISDTPGVVAFVYLLGLVLLYLYCIRLVASLFEKSWSDSKKQIAKWLSLTIIVVSAAGLASSREEIYDEVELGLVTKESISKKPNIIFLGSDGISTSNMSIYGYDRQTTPFLDSIADSLLIFENHFTNSANTTASVAALLSGKSPTTTQVIFRPDIFSGIHRYQHFPGVLKGLGYTNYDISIRYYIDPLDLNLHNSFSYSNGRYSETDPGLVLNISNHFPNLSLFIKQSYERVSSRLLHAARIRPMRRNYNEVVIRRPRGYEASDEKRIDDVKSILRDAKTPFFLNIHLLGTHGGYFYSKTRKFSRQLEQSAPWMTDFYDDAIVQFDQYVKEIVIALKAIGEYENTVLVITSDHGKQWAIAEPIPLAIRLPDKKLTGRVVNNSQRIDIAPTMLDLLGVSIPPWFEGQSLLSDEQNPMRFIYISRTAKSTKRNGWREIDDLNNPPFYSLGELSVVQCDRIFTLQLDEKLLKSRQIANHTHRCDPTQVIDNRQATQLIIQKLLKAGYDVSGLASIQIDGKSEVATVQTK